MRIGPKRQQYAEKNGVRIEKPTTYLHEVERRREACNSIFEGGILFPDAPILFIRGVLLDVADVGVYRERRLIPRRRVSPVPECSDGRVLRSVRLLPRIKMGRHDEGQLDAGRFTSHNPVHCR